MTILEESHITTANTPTQIRDFKEVEANRYLSSQLRKFFESKGLHVRSTI